MKKSKFIAISLICLILLSGITPIIGNYLNGLFSNLKQSNIGGGEGLYLDDISETSYYFIARGPCYILVEIEGIDFTYFIFDEKIYEVSHGFNVFPIKFPNNYQKVYQLEIDPENLEFFKSITVEPLFIAEDRKEVNLDSSTEINFKAGGPISILTRPTFAYNLLYLELQNENGGTTLLKRIQDGTEYPEIDPLFYCLFVERGTYIRYDINLEPGNYKLLLKGDGFLDYKIMVNLDWDEDLLDDVDEIQQEGLYEFDLDPIIADIWGFYEKSSDNQIFTRIAETDYTEGFFTFYIPELYPTAKLAFRINSGEFKEISIDGNYTFYEDRVFISDLNSPPEYEMFGNLEPGWHSISYLYKSNFTGDIDFLANFEEIKVFLLPEMLDSDGDGLKDFAEINGGLNPSKIDTDDDGIPDNFDSSPLAKLELDPLEINQIIIPTNIENNTLINLFIKKPINDYSTYGVPRYWNNVFNVSITPVLRLFGNKFNSDQDTKENMNREKLVELWGKDISLKFKSDVNFDETQIGDPLPASDDPDNEYYFIFPKSAEINFEYDIVFPRGHDSKNDGFLDLRFDFIWLVTKYDKYTKKTTLLHFYDFEEEIIVQSITAREYSNVNYILGSPDSFIENQILWTLTQNPSLGTPEDYLVNDDIIGNGTVDYYRLPERLIQDKMNHEEEIDQTEVLYVAGLYQNYDILNKIALLEEINPSFERVYNGDFEAFFSYYTINNVYTDQNYTFGDLEIQGENKILFQTYYGNLSVDSSTNIQKRANIIGIPISMNVYDNSNVLKIKQAQGANIPLEEISSIFDLQLCENIIILEQTYIEQNNQNQGIPLINFQVGVDIYKEFIDNRQDSVVLSDLFFNYQPYMPAEAFHNFIDKYYEQINSLKTNLNLLIEQILLDPDNNIDTQLMENMISDIDTFTQQHSFSDLTYYTSFFSFRENLKNNFEELIETGDLTTIFDTVSPTFVGDVGELVAKTSEAIVDQLAERGPKLDKINQHKQTNNKMKTTLKSQGRLGKLTVFSGATCAILGIAMIVFTIVEILHIIGQNRDGEYEGREAEYAMTLCSAFSTLALGTIILTKGIILLSMSSVKEATVASLKSAGKVLGAVGIVLSIFIVVFDWVKFAIRYSQGDIYDLKGALFDMIGTTVLAAVGIIIGLFASGIGAAFGILAGGLLILGAWITSKINNPSIDVIEENCKVVVPEETKQNIRRNGGLEVGDQIGFTFHVVEDGDTVVYMRARFRLIGETWTSVWDGWHGEWDGYCSKLQETFYAEIMGPALNVGFQLHFEMDWQKFSWYIFWFSFSREVGVRQVITEFLDMPALENSISEFYANTYEVTPLIFMQLYEKAVSEYKYKDAAYAAIKVCQTAEELAGISYYTFNSLIPRLVWYGDTYSHFMFVTTSQNEFIWYLTNFISQGIVPLALIVYYFSLDDLIELSESQLKDLLSLALDLYYHSGGVLLVPVGWINKRNVLFNYYVIYSTLFQNLPYHANCKVDLTDNVIKINPYLGYGEANLGFIVDWYHPWLKPYDKIFQYKIIAPEGFSIGPQDSIYDGFPATLQFNVIPENPNLIGTFEFILQIFLDSNLIYQETVPFYIIPLYKIEVITYNVEDPIIPGQFFDAIYINNTGNLAVMVNVSVEGIPDNFIYKGLYPNIYADGELVSGYIDNTLVIGLNPGEVKKVFIINPPRHYSTSPGPYTYTVHVEDHIYGNFDYEFIDTFIVAEFYDMNFQCLNPEIAIFDYETAIFTFNLQNFGNVIQEFNIFLDDISFAKELISTDTISLEPGEFQLFTLTITPTGWGEQYFSINASSLYNSSIIFPKIKILDDDIHPPEIISEIIETPINVTINFEVTNEDEGDDNGLSNFKIFIDDILIIDYNPFSTQTLFSFTFDDTFGDWFMGPGTHNIRIEAVDNDFDVLNDALSSSIFSTFETTFEDIFDYIYWQIKTLKDYIRNNLCSHLSKIWINKLSCAQKQLEKAFSFIENDRITCSLVHDAVAKVLLQIVEFKAEFFEKYSCIDENILQYIINSAQIIRNNIILLMGYTTGKDIGYEIALVEIDLLNLNDLIEDEITSYHNFNWHLKNLIRSATYKLESALFKIAMGQNIKCNLLLALDKLEKAEWQVNHLLCQGDITQDLADIILFKLNQAQDDINTILNLI